MYQLKKAEKIEEVIGLEGTDITIPVRLKVADIAKDFNVKYNNIIRAEQDLKGLKANPENAEKIMEAYGTAVINIFEMVFGTDGANKIFEYYENDYVDMTLEVFPFIRDVIVPKIQSYVNQQKKKIRHQYTAGR